MMQGKKHKDIIVSDIIADICHLRLTLQTLYQREVHVRKRVQPCTVWLTN